MKYGKSSNCVHWSYAVRTGTSTWIDFSTLVVIVRPPSSQEFTGAQLPPPTPPVGR
jgi:hypothetical protein